MNQTDRKFSFTTKVKFIVASVVLCSARMSNSEEPSVIRGTNVVMDIRSIFKWSGFANIYFSLDHAGTMTVAYTKLGIKDAIEKYKPKILRPQVDILEKEWLGNDEKYYLIFHEGTTGEKNKSYVLFMGGKDGTYVFLGRLNVDINPNAEEEILAVYRSGKFVNQRADLGGALFYEANLPDNYSLMELEGNRTFYEIGRGKNQEPDTVRFVGYIFNKKLNLKAYLLHPISSSDKVIFDGTVSISKKIQSLWKRVSFDSETAKYYIQYAMLKREYVLCVTAVIGAKNYRANKREMDNLVNRMEIKYPFGIHETL